MIPLPPLEDLIRLPELARRLGVTVDTTHGWRQRLRHPLRCWKIGGRWFTTEAALEEFAQAGTDPGPAVFLSTPDPTPTPTSAPRRKGRDPDGDWCRKRFGLG